MTPAALLCLALGLVVGLALAYGLPRLRKKPTAGLPYLTKEEILDTDAKLRMLLGDDPEPKPKRARRRPNDGDGQQSP